MYIYVHLPPSQLSNPPRINSKWLDYCADAKRLSSLERRQVFPAEHFKSVAKSITAFAQRLTGCLTQYITDKI